MPNYLIKDLKLSNFKCETLFIKLKKKVRKNKNERAKNES